MLLARSRACVYHGNAASETCLLKRSRNEAVGREMCALLAVPAETRESPARPSSRARSSSLIIVGAHARALVAWRARFSPSAIGRAKLLSRGPANIRAVVVAHFWKRAASGVVTICCF